MALDKGQGAVGIDREDRQLVVAATAGNVEETAVTGQVQGAGVAFAGKFLGRQAVGLQLAQHAVLVGEGHHLAGQFQGQVGVAPVGAEHQMARTAAFRYRHEGGLGGHQGSLRLLRHIAIDEDLVGAQIRGEDEAAIRGGHRRMHMAGLLACVLFAGLVEFDLRHRTEHPAVLDRQHRQGAFGQAGVVGDEQVLAVVAQAGMGRLVTQALDLTDLLQATIARLEAVGGDPANGIAARTPTILVDGEQGATIPRQGQKRRIGGLDDAQGAVDLAIATVEAIDVQPLAAARGVAADQQIEQTGFGTDRGMVPYEQGEQGQRQQTGQSSHGKSLASDGR